MVKGDYVMLSFEKINKVKARRLFNSGENIYSEYVKNTRGFSHERFNCFHVN